MTKTKKFFAGAAAAVALAAVSLSAGTTAAEAGWHHKHHWHKHYGYYAPFAVAAPFAYGYYNNCGWTWGKWGKKVYVCY